MNEIISKCPRDWEIIQLGQSNPDEMKLLLKENKIRQLGEKILYFCYVINRKGIKKIYNTCFNNQQLILKVIDIDIR